MEAGVEVGVEAGVAFQAQGAAKQGRRGWKWSICVVTYRFTTRRPDQGVKHLRAGVRLIRRKVFQGRGGRFGSRGVVV